jgi:hypothetical protein
VKRTPTRTTVTVIVSALILGGLLIGFRLLVRRQGEPLLALPVFDAPPATCPLTGQEPREAPFDQRVLAVKIENSPDARPQMGLAEADIVYEEEAEGGITRFIVLYNCRDADRIGPIRSVRETDPLVLAQYGDPLFVHSGGIRAVLSAVEKAGIEDIDCRFEEETCPRDERREMPHDIFSSTRNLRALSDERGKEPEPLFEYDSEPPEGAKRGRNVHLNFSPYADVSWRYRNGLDAYVRFHGEEPHVLEDGTRVAATNVVVLVVPRLDTNRTDVAGNPVPSFDVIGAGDAFVFRNGRVTVGRWQRDSVHQVTQLLDQAGDEIALAPGNTWIELFPSDAIAPPEF